MIGINVEGLIRIQYFDINTNAEAALAYTRKLVKGDVNFEVILLR